MALNLLYLAPNISVQITVRKNLGIRITHSKVRDSTVTSLTVRGAISQANLLHPSSVEDKNKWSCTSVAPYAQRQL